VRCPTDNKYHVPGRLKFADRGVIKNLVNTSTPLLCAGGDANKIILSPLMRYAGKKCCDNKDHITNRRDKKKFLSSMGESVRDMKDAIKDFVFGKKLKAFKVLSPILLLADDDDYTEAAIKMLPMVTEDPVHLRSEGYSSIITKLLTKLDDENFCRQHSQTLQSSNSSTLRQPAHFRWQQWVDGDDTYAHRDYSISSRVDMAGAASAEHAAMHVLSPAAAEATAATGAVVATAAARLGRREGNTREAGHTRVFMCFNC
jgi:hypothetical protein